MCRLFCLYCMPYQLIFTLLYMQMKFVNNIFQFSLHTLLQMLWAPFINTTACGKAGHAIPLSFIRLNTTRSVIHSKWLLISAQNVLKISSSSENTASRRQLDIASSRHPLNTASLPFLPLRCCLKMGKWVKCY